MLHCTAINWFLNVCIALSALFALWLLVGTNWYLMFIVVIFSFKVIDASFSIKWKPGWIPRIFKSSVNDVKALIISLSLLLFIDVVRMALQSYTYITYMYLPPLIEMVGKRLHRYEYILPSLVVLGYTVVKYTTFVLMVSSRSI